MLVLLRQRIKRPIIRYSFLQFYNKCPENMDTKHVTRRIAQCFRL